MTARNPKAAYACVSRGEAVCPSETEARPVCIDSGAGEVIAALADKI